MTDDNNDVRVVEIKRRIKLTRYFESSSLDKAQLKLLRMIITHGTDLSSRNGDTRELLNMSFTIPAGDKSTTSTRKPFNSAFAKAFARWMVERRDSVSYAALLKLNPKVASFFEHGDLPPSFNTFYGPRIDAQLPYVIHELANEVNSRRATIPILQLTDRKVIASKQTGMEYPCTGNYNFHRRADKINLTVNMRSSNVGLVLMYDCYNANHLLQYIVKLVNGKSPLACTAGTITFNIDSAHFLYRQRVAINTILNTPRRTYKLTI